MYFFFQGSPPHFFSFKNINILLVQFTLQLSLFSYVHPTVKALNLPCTPQFLHLPFSYFSRSPKFFSRRESPFVQSELLEMARRENV